MASIVMQAAKDHSGEIAAEPAIEFSDEVLALFSRAELASAQARQLLNENDRWQQSVLQQLDYMFELGAEFRRAGRSPSQ